jgi:hypothetical protein
MKLDHKKIAAVCLAVGLCAVCLAPPVRASESAESCSLDKAGKQTPRVESTGAAASATQQPLSGIANLSTHACLAGVWDASVKARQIVDIRPANIFNSLQAANSLNIAMGSLAHREFLKLAPVLLIGDGKADFELTAMCEPLRASGFKDVRVLKGGLRTLHLEDYPIVGNPRAIEALDTLSPQELHNLVGRDAWKVLATKSDAAEATRLGIRVDAEVTDASDVSKRLLTLLAATSGTDWIVIGIPLASIPDLRNTLPKRQRGRVLFYTDPVRAYAAFLQQQRSVLADAGKSLIRPCNQF